MGFFVYSWLLPFKLRYHYVYQPPIGNPFTLWPAEVYSSQLVDVEKGVLSRVTVNGQYCTCICAWSVLILVANKRCIQRLIADWSTLICNLLLLKPVFDMSTACHTSIFRKCHPNYALTIKQICAKINTLCTTWMWY